MNITSRLFVRNLDRATDRPHLMKSLVYHWQQLFHKLGVKQKISLSFGLSVGAVVVLTLGGQIIESLMWQNARNKLVNTSEAGYLLLDLQKNLLQAHNNEDAIVNSDGELSFLLDQANQIYSYVLIADRIVDQLQDIESQQPEPEVTTKILEHYHQILKNYRSELQPILAKFQEDNLSETDKAKLTQSLLDFFQSPISTEMDQLNYQMIDLIKKFQKDKRQSLEKMEQAKTIELVILVSSLLLAIGITMMISRHISGTIALPLKILNGFAQRVTDTSNFDLHSPVMANDELGQLTASFNKLIARVKAHNQELKMAHTQLIQAEKMSSLGQLVAGIAHEINNPVNFIYGNIKPAKDYAQELIHLVSLYQQYCPHPPAELQAEIDAIDPQFIVEDLGKILDSMSMGTERIKQLVLSLRNFSRLDEAEIKPVDLHEGMENTLLILNQRLKSGIKINKDYGELPPVECYPALLNQVFMNIINNAVDALLEKTQPLKQINISTKQVDVNEVQVRIIDNAGGISPEIVSKIFDPFFTTKPVGKGTGLGLAIAYQIIEKHKGKIEVLSEAHQGTEFIITFPVHQKTS